MSKLRIPLTFALSAIVFSHCTLSKSSPSLPSMQRSTITGHRWSIKADRSSVSIPSETRITGVECSGSTKPLKERN